MAIEGRDAEDGQLQVISKEILERSDGDVRGVIASVDAQSFVDLITADDGETIKRHLFDDNLRVFLGAKGGYNQDIISTATSGDSYLFWYLNNGVTITCKSFSYNKGHTNPKLVFKDFQIVNGVNQTGFTGEHKAWKVSHDKRKFREPFFDRSAGARGAFGA